MAGYKNTACLKEVYFSLTIILLEVYKYLLLMYRNQVDLQ